MKDLLTRLLSFGLLDEQTLVRDGACVLDVGRSHAVALVEIGGVSRWIVKRYRPPRGDHDGTITRERAALAFAAAHPFLSRHVPRVVAELAADVLVLEAFEGASLWEAPADMEALPGVARVLGEMHAETRDLRAAPSPLPWILRIMDSDAPNCLWEERAQTLLALGARAAAVAGLRRLRRDWSSVCLIHGDAKLDNVLATRDGRIVLLDWELAGRGDPLWDLAGVCLRKLYVLGDSDAPLENWWENAAAELTPSLRAHGESSGRSVETSHLVGLMGAWLLQSSVTADTAHVAGKGLSHVARVGCAMIEEAHALSETLARRLL